MQRGLLFRPRCATLTALAAAALAAGCGEPDPVDDRDGVLHLELTEYRLDPQVIKTARRQITLVAHNSGRLGHNVVVEEERAPDDPPGERPRVLGRTRTARPGASVRTTRRVRLQPGRYRLACSIGNHDDLGQFGTLIVTR